MSVHQWYNDGPGQDYSAGWKPLLCSLTSHHLLVQNGAPLEHKPIRLQSLLRFFFFFFSVSWPPFLCHGSWNSCGGPQMGESPSSDAGTTSWVVVSAVGTQHSVAASVGEAAMTRWTRDVFFALISEAAPIELRKFVTTWEVLITDMAWFKAKHDDKYF